MERIASLLAAGVAVMNDSGIREGVAASSPCKVDFGNSTFDLSPLTQQSSYYVVSDDRGVANASDWTYYFNFCADVSPTEFKHMDVCNSTYPGGINSNTPSLAMNGTGPVFQWHNVDPTDNTNFCHRLSGPVTATNPNYFLVDPTNPAVGVVVQYTGGDQCGIQYFANRRRSLRIWMMCYNNQGSIPSEETVLEADACTYDIFVYTAYGCPADCPLVVGADGSKHLCSGHGVCDFDRNIGHSRCFCNDGFSGADCAGPTPPPPSGLTAVGGVLLAVGVMLLATLGFLVYLWNRIRGLRLDPTAYSALRGGPDMDGGAATLD